VLKDLANQYESYLTILSNLTEIRKQMLSNIKSFFWPAVFAGLLAVRFLTSHYSEDKWDNPRGMRGRDTVYTADSIYVIDFKIDTAFVSVQESIYD
jgi:hypothetical protein